VARIQEIVADASVACKWFLPEKGAEAALSLRENHIEGRVRILAPELICYEVANALRYHPAINTEKLRDSIRSLYDLQLSFTHLTSSDLSFAAEFARRHRVSVYDASYAILAEKRSCPLVTDDALLLKVSRRAVRLSDWTSHR